MTTTKVLIAVKTYPTQSTKYDELVCTAGFREDGSWIRLYPITFRRYLYGEQYAKWDWIEIDCARREKDFRPETFHPKDSTVPPKVLERVGTADHWRERKEFALRKVYDDLELLISHAQAQDPNNIVSLATFKPSEILDFTWESAKREWSAKQLSRLSQLNLFSKSKGNDFKPIPKLPYKFSYKFRDCKGKESNLMIEDWEVGALYWNCLERQGGDESKALEQVKEKFLTHFTQEKDLYFFLGTTLRWHKTASPFVIIGAFYPPVKKQMNLI